MRSILTVILIASFAWSQEAPPIRNFLKINENYCTGGQPRVDQLAKLKEDGIKVIINLRPPGEHRSQEEEDEAKRLGFKYINIPVVYGSPTDENADQFLKVTDDPQNRPAFIHCAAAIRAGAFWMIRRVLRDKWSIADAEEEAKKIGLVNAPHMTEFAKKYIETHKK